MNQFRSYGSRGTQGFSLVETLVSLAIFSILTAGIFSAFNLQVKETRRESSVGRSEIEFNIAKGLLERDLGMAGYGLADDYNGLTDENGNEFDPRAYSGVEETSNPDELILMGTGLGINSRAAQGWTYRVAYDPLTPSIEYATWSDAREDLESGDRVLLMDPSTKTLLSQKEGSTDYWLYEYKGSNAFPQVAHSNASSATLSLPERHLVYGLYGSGSYEDDDKATVKPYYAVRYYLGGSSFPQYCSDGTKSLLRAESRETENPGYGEALLSCVLDFQVAFGLDRDENGTIDTWDNGGGSFLNGYTMENQRKRLKQVRAYLLVQSGARDTEYNYPQSKVRVGETLTAEGATQITGREVDLTNDQRQYRWQLLVLNLMPRNLQ